MKRFCFFLAICAAGSGLLLGFYRWRAYLGDETLITFRTTNFGSPLRSRVDRAFHERCPGGSIDYETFGILNHFVRLEMKCGETKTRCTFKVQGSKVEAQDENAAALVKELSQK